MVVSESKPPSLKEIGAFLKEHDIAIQKFPEYVLMCDELPRTASGKIQKFRLRREAEQRIALGEGESR
jgi:acyl-CoA synthetase (AMP-forming)/AMP-acid ligase II